MTRETVRARRGSQNPCSHELEVREADGEIHTDFSRFDGFHISDFDFMLPCRNQ